MDRDHFLLVSPAIVPRSQVPQIDLPDETGNPNDQVLLVWGTGRPYRDTSIYLAAVRVRSINDRTRWRYFDVNGGWSRFGSSTGAARLYTPPDPTGPSCGGEISVTWNEPTRKWMLTYACGTARFPQGRPTGGATVLLRTADRPEGPWSAPRVLYAPKANGLPADADDGYGTFIHHGNRRAWHACSGCGFQNLFGDELESQPVDPPTACAQSFPSTCEGPAEQNEFDPNLGCCTNPNVCCDDTYDRFRGSSNSGAAYAPYIVQPWSRVLARSGTTVTKHRVHFVLSTWNPYTVVLMRADLDEDDTDNDGVPNATDNCPATFNPDQANCNRDAERAWNVQHPGAEVPLLGDACDPVPCPEATADRIVTKRIVTGNCQQDPYRPGICIGRTIRDRIDMTPVGSSPLEALRSDSAPGNIPVPNVTTHARFCQHNAGLQYRCDQLEKLRDAELSFDVGGDPDHLWHAVTLAHASTNSCRLLGGYLVCSGIEPPSAVVGSPFALTYGTQVTSARWAYAEDYARWTAASPAVIPPPEKVQCLDLGTYGRGSCLAGRLWLNGDTSVGNASNAFAGSRHVGNHGDELANHYFAAMPDAPFSWAYGGLAFHRIFFLVKTLPDPPPPFWSGYKGAAPIIEEGGHFFAVFEDGRRELADEAVDPSARPLLFDPRIRWTPSAEPFAHQGNPSFPVAVALATDGTVVHAGAYTIATGRLEVSRYDDDLSEREHARGLGMAIAERAEPPPRTEFAAAYTRATGRVFVVGGRDGAGRRVDDVWAYSFSTESWSRVALPPGVLGDVEAATFSWRDGRLWVVDVIAKHRERVRRILRIEVESGAYDVVASSDIERHPLYEHRGLFVDGDGRIGFFASSDHHDVHRIATIETSGSGFEIRITKRRERALSASPIPDLGGYVLHYEPAEKNHSGRGCRDRHDDDDDWDGGDRRGHHGDRRGRDKESRGEPAGERLLYLPVEKAKPRKLDEMLR